jgi:hypothetical protein
MKISYIKLDEENKKNSRLIQDIIEEATKNNKEVENIEDLDINNINIMSLQRLKDVRSIFTC